MNAFAGTASTIKKSPSPHHFCTRKCKFSKTGWAPRPPLETIPSFFIPLEPPPAESFHPSIHPATRGGSIGGMDGSNFDIPPGEEGKGDSPQALHTTVLSFPPLLLLLPASAAEERMAASLPRLWALVFFAITCSAVVV